VARACAAIACLFIGCNLFGAVEPKTARESALVVGKARDVIGLDPARVSDDESVEVCEQIYEHLVRYAPDSTAIEPGLAVSWDVFDNGTTWVFKLREGIEFHDGTPMDADAVVFSLERQRDPFHPAHEPDFFYWRDQYSYIEKIEKIDRLTVRIKIERSYAPFLSSLAMFPAAIVSPAAVKKWGKAFPKHPVGTGPFRFAAWTPGDRVVLERNDRYWGAPPPLERIVFRSIPDARQRLVALEGGAVEVAFAILPEELQYVKLHPDLTLHHVAVANVAYVAMNTQRPPWNDVGVRQAVNRAVNKVPIVRLLYQGLAVPARGPVPPSLWGYEPDAVDYPYDPAAAKDALVDAAARGAFDPARRYTLYVPRTPRSYLPEPEQVGRVLQRNLEQVGIQVDVIAQEFGAHQADCLAGKHDLCLYGWTADNGDPDNFLKVLLDRDELRVGPEQNIAFYRNAELHGLLTYAEETFDQKERGDFYRRAQIIVAREAPWVPIAHSELLVAARNEVHGLMLHPTSTVYYQKAWVDR
jgi:peptide/nickel transport system substrate-binding protein